jgi:glucuronosyltransferase
MFTFFQSTPVNLTAVHLIVSKYKMEFKKTIGIFVLVLFFTEFPASSAHRILVLSPITTYSHDNYFKTVVEALVDRGHFVTYWTGLPSKNQDIKNQSDNLRQFHSPPLHQINSDHHFDFNERDRALDLLFTFPRRMETYCKAIYNDPVFHQLMNSAGQYDLMIIEGAANECVLPLVHKLKMPFIYMMGTWPSPWQLDAIGSTLGFDHYPNLILNFGDEMNLWQRTINTLSGLVALYYWRWNVMTVVDRIASETLSIDNLTTIEEIEQRYLSLFIFNTHFSLNYQLPPSSSVIQAAGLNCAPSKPLTKDLESFVDGSGDDGCIILSFGSILKGIDLPDEVRRLFLSTFSRLKQLVIWKWEDESKLGKDDLIPPNVKFMSWLPQQDLLGHPKVRLFITHGGLNSIQEAVYHRVPLIILPVFVDQPINARIAQSKGIAISLEWQKLTEDVFYDAIQQILSDPRLVFASISFANAF